jgi:hypothetical protein
MAHPNDHAQAVCRSIHLLLLDRIGIREQIRNHKTETFDNTNRTFRLEQVIEIGDIFYALEIRVVNYHDKNYVKIKFGDSEYESFEVSNDVNERLPEFTKVYSPDLYPTVKYLEVLFAKLQA